MAEHSLPAGYLAAGIHAGVKSKKRDFGIIISERPMEMAAVVTQNAVRAPSVDRSEALVKAGRPARAWLMVSGNANALTGRAGAADDEQLAAWAAAALGVAASEVLTASTGVIGTRLPMDRLEAAVPRLVDAVGRRVGPFAESIMTTDRVTKVAARALFVGGRKVEILGVTKGAGMIAPTMATMLGAIVTDADVPRAVLDACLRAAVAESFNRITVDEDMSTNDLVLLGANGASGAPPIAADSDDEAHFRAALTEVCQALALAIVRDGEGANRVLEVRVAEAPDVAVARRVAHAMAGSNLVKAGVFGGDPNIAGRLLAAAGSVWAGERERAPSVAGYRLMIQGVEVFGGGEPVAFDPVALRHRMLESTVSATLSLGAGTAAATAWGCELTYDYVKINADYAAATTATTEGVRVDDELQSFGPSLKKKTLIEALRYIDRFRGRRAVIKLGGAAMVDPVLEAQFAEDVLLLASVGLRPIVVHGGGPEISRTLERLGHETEFRDGLRVTDGAAMDVVEMVLTGRVNQGLVGALNQDGPRAVGLSGKDGGLVRVRQMSPALGRVGEIACIDPGIIHQLESAGYIPVISPVGLGPDGASYNVNADVVAASLAEALAADKLIFLSDVAGVLEGGAVLSELTAEQLEARLQSGAITGGMKPKLASAAAALKASVRSVHIVDGRVPHNLIAELFTDRGVGTLIRG